MGRGVRIHPGIAALGAPMSLNGSHNDRRRRRWALDHRISRVVVARRLSWWRRLVTAFTTWRARAPEVVEPARMPRPIYGRGGAR